MAEEATQEQPEQMTLPFTGLTQDVPEEQVAALPQGKTPTPETKPGEQVPPGLKSRFVPQDPVKVVQDFLKIPHIDPHLQEMLRAAHMRQTKDGKGLLIDMDENGHSIEIDKLKNGTEYIGLSGNKTVADAHDAQVMVGLAKSRGWNSINVNGSAPEKERMWLEAQRQGLKVANYQPKPGSEVYKQWQQEQQHGGRAAISEAPGQDFHVETMKLLHDKAKGAEDPAVRDGLKKMLHVYTEGQVIGNEKSLKSLSDALSDKNSPRDGFNKAVDIVNAASDGQAGLGKLEGPGAEQGTDSKVQTGPASRNRSNFQARATQP